MKIISGGQGEGKTTYLREYAAHATDRGRSVGGVASVAIFKDDQRIGYDLLDLRQGVRRPLARVAVPAEEPPTVGMYRFDEEAVAAGNAAILVAVRDGLDIVAIDEVGPWEFRGGGWAPGLKVALADCSATQELVVVVRPALVDLLPRAFPAGAWETAERVSAPWSALT